MKVLVLEDNERLCNLVSNALKKEGFKVDMFTDGENALEALANGYHCFILDINVPCIDGISILDSIRMMHEDVPVIIISSNHELEKIQLSYEIGCDDYLKKPFFMYELVKKVKKLCNVQKGFLLFNEDYKYDFINHILYKNEEEIELTKKEILFLELFSKNLHHVANYDEIIEYVWEGDDTNLTNIRAMIKRLRKKLPYEVILSVKGMGYSLNKKVEVI